MVIEIKKAEYKNNYKILLVFSDGKERLLDFKSFIKAAKNPMTRKYLDLKKFRKFQLVYGDLCWGDYEMCFPIWNLYEGKYDAQD